MTAIYKNIIAADVDLVSIRGDKPVFRIAFWEDEANSIPVDLSPFIGNIKMQIRTTPTATRVLDTLEDGTGLTIGGVDNNELTIVPNMMEVDTGNYYYDVEESVLNATILRGRYITEQDVTR